MHKIFLWFYRLPMGDAVMLILLATGCFLLLREKLRDRAYWKVSIALLLSAWIAVILYGTLGQRTEGGNLSEPVLTPFASYYAALHGGSKELYRTNFMNAVLFYPAGLLACELLPRRWHWLWKAMLVAAVFALVSAGIEFTQYRFGLGLAEVDDVIHNALGTLLGAIVCAASIKLLKT